MTVKNIYTGSRYVPQILDLPWDNTKNTQYESLSVVIYGGNSYTSKRDVPVGIDILNETFWVCTGNYNVQVANYKEDVDNFKITTNEILNYVNRKVNNILVESVAAMKLLDCVVGDTIQTIGYYAKGDGGGCLYSVVDSNSLIDDGGSVHELSNGLFAKIICQNGVDCKLFGAKHGMTQSESILIFDSWTNYVNTTRGKYFKPSFVEGGYEIFKPMLIRKSFIGEGDEVRFFYQAETVGKLPVSLTITTLDTHYDFNINAVMGINPLDYGDSGDRLQFANFEIFCSSTEDSVGVRQDIGIYFPQGTSFDMDDIIVWNPDKSGFYFMENWMARISRLNTFKSNLDGFWFGNSNRWGVFTSLVVQNCYAHKCEGIGFFISKAVYSTFMSLGCDIGNANRCYGIHGCESSTFRALGCEGFNGKKVFELNGNKACSIENIYVKDVTLSEEFIYIYSNSSLTIKNIRFSGTINRATSTSPKLFNIGTSNEVDTNTSIDIHYEETLLCDDGYIATSIVATNGIATFYTKGNIIKYGTSIGRITPIFSKNQVNLGHQTVELTPTQIQDMVLNEYGVPTFYFYSLNDSTDSIILGMFVRIDAPYGTELKMSRTSTTGLQKRQLIGNFTAWSDI